MEMKYSLIIRWSEEDHCFIAWIPEFGPAAKTHGDSYESAAKAGREIIEALADMPASDRPPLASPWLYRSPEVDTRIGKSMLPDNAAYRSSRKPSAVA
jgi:predicted RNase H-like HicB family nuclease